MLRIQRRFNFTGRIDFDATDVSLRTSTNEQGVAIAHLDHLQLPLRGGHDESEWTNADVVLEAVRMATSSYRRNPIGTVADVVVGNFSRDIVLDEFEGAGDILFRLKVVARDDKRLLAAADRIHASGELPPPERDELIVVRVDDLGELPWRVDWTEPELVGPIVKVNKNLHDAETYLKRDALSIGAIIPQIFREVLYRICAEPHLRDTEWCKRWIGVIRRIHDEPVPSIEDLREDGISIADQWVSDVLSQFAVDHQMTTRTNELLESLVAND